MTTLVQYFKVVNQLPAVLEVDSLYYVKTGSGFDLYVSNNTGTSALKINAVSPDSFESFSKNLASNPAAISYVGDIPTTITYTVGVGSVVKTFSYDINGNLSSIALSGDIPPGMYTMKTFIYTGDKLTGFSYA